MTSVGRVLDHPAAQRYLLDDPVRKQRMDELGVQENLVKALVTSLLTNIRNSIPGMLVKYLVDSLPDHGPP